MVGFVTYIAALIRAAPEVADGTTRSRAHALIIHLLVSLQRLSIFLGIVVATWGIVVVFDRPVDDPIGLESDAGLGSGPCSIQELKSVTNSIDEMAHVRYSICPAGGPIAIIAVDDFTYFLFVHKIGRPNAADGLVLRYDALGYNDTPKIRWATASRLIVTLHRADMGRVTKQRTLLDGIEIVYDIEN
jgi:hypothetical protein